MEKLINEIFIKIQADAEQIVLKNLRGIKGPYSVFDLGKVDYKLDGDELSYRIKNITENILILVITEALPRLQRMIEKQVRDKLLGKIIAMVKKDGI